MKSSLPGSKDYSYIPFKEEMMRKSLAILIAVAVTFAICTPVFAAGGQETKGSAASTSGWVPYYQKADFKAFVSLPEMTKAQLGTVKDEMTVKPVDRVAPKLVKIAVIGAATNPAFDIIKAGVDDAADTLIAHNCKVDWIIPGSTLSSSDVNAVMDTILVKKYDATPPTWPVFRFRLRRQRLLQQGNPPRDTSHPR